MRLIQQFLPEPRHREIHRIFVRARPEAAWEAARHFDAGEIPWIQLLFNLRTLPARLTGHAVEVADTRIGVDQIADNDNGFYILAENPGREVVIGSVGQFWHLEIPFAGITPVEFRDFDAPGWGKLAWSISVAPYGNGSTVAFELRTTATDDVSWDKLQRYFLVIGFFSRQIRSSVMKHLEAALGKWKLPDEDDIPLPGDEQLPDAKYQLNHRSVIEAPAALVWRYLMQLGCDRAGWYSIDAIDNGGSKSVERLVPGWESRAPGDRIAADPAATGFFEVFTAEPEQALVIGNAFERLGGQFRMSWAFVLEPVGDDACLLHTRVRAQGAPALLEWLLADVIYPPVHALMQGVQLKTIKRLAEAAAMAR